MIMIMNVYLVEERRKKRMKDGMKKTIATNISFQLLLINDPTDPMRSDRSIATLYYKLRVSNTRLFVD